MKIIIKFLAIFAFTSFSAQAADLGEMTAPPDMPTATPVINVTPPVINAKAYILVDADSGKIIAEKNSELRMPPASLTKMMTLYVVSNALKHQKIHLDDKVRVSEEAWKAEGSRMFLNLNEEVSIENLLKGIIVDSGNDACIAVAETISGSEESFASVMNFQAQNLGMNDSHFTDSTGLPNPQHYTTAKDLAVLGRALINHFPEYYHWYKQKWFTYNNIKQPNRNRLLWRKSNVDGIKTGHTDEAGFCLVSSAKQNNMRLIAVILNAPSDNVRADDSEKLLNYGFKFYETHKLYSAKQTIIETPTFKGKEKIVKLGFNYDHFVTIPYGQYNRLKIATNIPKYIEAPIKKGDKMGEIVIKMDNEVLGTYPLYSLNDVAKSGFIRTAADSVSLQFKKWLS
jgi:serine-type D-Ala-D-Ala carboxypeptidase (penicillin-binding protein 5/6)